MQPNPVQRLQPDNEKKMTFMKNEYQEQIHLPNVAKAMSKNRRVSVKYATEICREIKGKPVQRALNFLQVI